MSSPDLSWITPEHVIQARREAASRSLVSFVKMAWHVLEPGAPYIHGRHIDVIAEHLEAVHRGEIRRLLINVPPGAMKSLLCGVFFPAWEWGPMNRPDLRYVGVAHEQGLGVRDNLKCRRLIESPWYQNTWGDRVSLVKDQNEKLNFENTARGFRQVATPSNVTGKRGDRVICLSGDARVLSSRGWVDIKSIVDGRVNVKIAGTNGHEVRWQEIEAFERNPGRESVRITAQGRAFRCTIDHPVYVSGRGWVEAGAIRAGDRIVVINDEALRELRGEVPNEKACGAELQRKVPMGAKEEQGAVSQQQALRSVWDIGLPNPRAPQEKPEALLLTSLHGKGADGCGKPCVSRRTGDAFVQSVPSAVREEDCGGGEAEREHMLSGVCGKAKLGSVGEEVEPEAMPAMLKYLQAEPCGEEVLQSGMRGRCSLIEDEREGERAICSRRGQKEISARVVRGAEAEDQNSGRNVLRNVQGFSGFCGDASRSSYRLREGKPGRVQSDQPLQVLPREGAWRADGSFGLEEAVVEHVECAGWLEETYNLRVGPDHVYFVEGFLLHNCDDLLSAENANSEAIREGVNRWYRESLPTRLNKPSESAIVNIMQRLHERDVSGLIMGEELGYETVVIPMRFEPDRTFHTSLGPVDWRTDHGELMFPDRFPEDVVSELEKTLGSYGAASQLQQRPAPREGGLFKSSWFEIIDALPTGNPSRVRAWDLAATKKAGTNNPDWTAGLRMARYPDGTFLIENVRRLRGSPLEVEQAVMQTAHLDGTGVIVRMTQDPGQAGKAQAEQFVRKLAGFPVVTKPATGDKATRATPAAAQAEVGNIKILRTGDKDQDAWIQPFLDEIALFPAGAHDDQVDTLADAVNELALANRYNIAAW